LSAITLVKAWQLFKLGVGVRDWWKRRKAQKEIKEVEKQVLQGGITYTGLGVVVLAKILEILSFVPEGYDATTTAAVLIGAAIAAYGRIRLEWRKE